MRRVDNLNIFLCRLSSKSGSLNLLEPSGPVQACNGIALRLQIHSKSKLHRTHRIYYSLQSEKFHWEATHILYHWLLGPVNTGCGKIISLNFKVNNRETIRDTNILFLDSETTTWEALNHVLLKRISCNWCPLFACRAPGRLQNGPSGSLDVHLVSQRSVVVLISFQTHFPFP